jgi:hypothetical protein
MLAFNLDIIQKREMNNIIKKGEYSGKFTELIMRVLRELKTPEAEKELAWRKSSETGNNNIGNKKEKNEKEKTKTEEDKNYNDLKNIKKIIFVECIHFIVCCIDNILHPTEEIDNNGEIHDDADIYAKIVGKRSLKSLESGLIQFFKDPKSIEELTSIMEEEERKEKERKEKDEIVENKEEDKKSQENKEQELNKTATNEEDKENQKNKKQEMNKTAINNEDKKDEKKEGVKIEQSKKITPKKEIKNLKVEMKKCKDIINKEMKITNNNNILEREIKKKENCVMGKNEIKEEIQNEKESNEIIDN